MTIYEYLQSTERRPNTLRKFQICLYLDEVATSKFGFTNFSPQADRPFYVLRIRMDKNWEKAKKFKNCKIDFFQFFFVQNT